ncbi:multiple monosaccharide ABC transporter permease [Breznakiellaceae bacterium SP9]
MSNNNSLAAQGIMNGLKKNTMLIALVVVMLFFHILIISTGKGNGLFDPATITNLISQNAYVVVLASGMLLCILTGGNIDLSVGSIVVLVGALAGTFIVTMQMPLVFAILICLVCGLAIGAFHGFWIAYVRIPPFIVTLAGMLLWRGIAHVVLNGMTISAFPETYLTMFTSFLPSSGVESASPGLIFGLTLGVGIALCLVLLILMASNRIRKAKKGYTIDPSFMFIIKLVVSCFAILFISFLLGRNKGIPVVLILISVIVLIYQYFTSRTVPGRYLYALGGNEKAAKMSGINTNKMLFFAYANMGFLSAVTALMCVARFDSASPSAGTNYELDAIASCFIGGASAYGGTGTVGGAVIGAVFMGVLNQGMSIMSIDQNWQRAVKGLVLLAAVVFDVLSKNKKRGA